jgi:hypothetical protein
LVREQLKTVVELYENFAKLSKLEALHFHMLKQQIKAPKHVKPQGQRITMTPGSIATQSILTTSILMAMSLQKTEKRILDQPRKKGVREPSTTKQTSTIKGVTYQVEAEVMAKAHSSLRTACTTAAISTTA